VTEPLDPVRITRAAEDLLRPLAAAPPELRVPALQPRDTDYAAVFVDDAANIARAGYARLWASPPKALGKPGQTEVAALAALAESLREDGHVSRELPFGYRRIAGQLRPGSVWIAFKLVVPGQTTGMAYDGLVWLGDHWAFFPKPWRVLDAATAN